jgi:hypothetical protein
MSSKFLTTPSIDPSRLFDTHPRILYTPSVGRTSAFAKTSIRILTSILVLGLFPGVSAYCYVDWYAVTVMRHPRPLLILSPLPTSAGMVMSTATHPS